MKTKCRSCPEAAVILLRQKYYCASCALSNHYPRRKGRETPAEKRLRKEKEEKGWPNR